MRQEGINVVQDLVLKARSSTTTIESSSLADMKTLTLFAFALVALLALCVRPVSAAPPYPYHDQPVAADWWFSYLNTHAHKQPPSTGVVYRARNDHLAQHFDPFRQRLERLTRLKQ